MVRVWKKLDEGKAPVVAEFPSGVFRARLAPQELSLVESLNTPQWVQDFLRDELRYNFEEDGDTA